MPNVCMFCGVELSWCFMLRAADTDTSVRMDPYIFLKSPPYMQFNQIVQYDDNAPEINCGIQYGQNIASDGPLAWIAAEVADRTLRRVSLSL